MPRLIKATLVAGVLIAALAQPASAADGPEPITIETTRQGPFGSFDASGAFADSGAFAVQNPVFGGPGPGRFVNVHATETFSGADGTFTVVRTLRVTWGDDPAVRSIDGTWAVIAGTGAYEDLHAQGRVSGSVSGFPPAEVFVLTYTGLAGG